ncbi:hypothetical protein D7X33_29385 [Butyricicoccus sp. 1XD8-22]|nr:hypothetical protein D7X33_29385 [Butyricicoccus sp. 1XD8-22]
MKEEINELVMETTQSFNEYLKKLPKGCRTISHLLRVNNIPEALTNILHFSEGAMWLIQTNELLNQNGVYYSIQTEQINNFLNEINNGLEIQDYVLVADIFEYEIAPFFEDTERIRGIES